MFIHLNKKGQNTLEYAVVIAVIVAALIAMSSYIKRGVQGKLRDSSNDIGDQFSPQTTSSTSLTSITQGHSVETISGGPGSTTNVVTNQAQNKNTSENVGALDQEWYP